VETLEYISGGRLEFGLGAGWLREEWAAAGVDFESRGRRLDECLEVCIRLWTQDRVAHRGEFFSFSEVGFEPTPARLPSIHVGGESGPAFRRTLRFGAGWIGMHHSPESAARQLKRLRKMAAEAGRPVPQATVAANPGPDLDLPAWEETGVDRVIVAPWTRSSEAIDGMRGLAARMQVAARS
jgi:alkanesulfonate monooxygenase SsuD/methylene tetrahydromethanopterin reductase-like flavin-dependent oxidoreductase (luciferase family)